MKMKKMENNLEIEYKYWAGELSQEEFHDKIEKAIGAKISPKYVVSCDDYYIRNTSKNEFVRYRKGSQNSELTLKFKREANTIRKEINLNISGNDDLSVVEFLKLSGYKKSFSVFKEAWIYHTDNCDISYYTLSDGRSVVEVEATNMDVSNTVKDAITILDGWASVLGLTNLKREKRSLFEIFTEELTYKATNNII